MAVVVDTDALAPRERPEAVMAVFGANEGPPARGIRRDAITGLEQVRISPSW
jgi:hypothetical protein